MCPHLLRSLCIAAAQISVAFFTTRVLDPASGLPWSLAVGDISNNLRVLAAGPPPSERTALKIWQLCQWGYNRQLLIRGVALLLDCPWGTVPAEQLHSSAASLMRLHPEYHTETLLSRAAVMQLNRLLGRASSDAKAIKRVRRRFEKLLRKRPQKLRAENMYVKDIAATAKTYKWTSQRPKPPDLHHKVIRGAAARFKAQPLAVRKQYKAKAELAIAENEHALAEDKEALCDEICLRQARIDEAADTRMPLSMTGAAWGNMELTLFGIFHASVDFNLPMVEQLRARAQEAPTPPTANFMRKLAQHDAPDDCDELARTQPWFAGVCTHRDHFRDCSLVFHGVFSDKVFRCGSCTTNRN